MDLLIRKWNFEEHRYENTPNIMALDVWLEPEDATFCANCGKPMIRGNGYDSLQWHNRMGLAYCVCGKCYEIEWEMRKKYKREC